MPQEFFNKEAINDGWMLITEVWTRASNTSITVPAGASNRFMVGDKLKILDNGTLKYFYITAIADTTLTITGGSDYVLATSPTTMWLSRVQTPQGFPGFFNYTPVLFAQSPMSVTAQTLSRAVFDMVGLRVNYSVIFLNVTLSGSSAFVYCSTPITNLANTAGQYGAAYIYESGTTPTQKPGLSMVYNNPGRIGVYKHNFDAYVAGSDRNFSMQGFFYIQ